MKQHVIQVLKNTIVVYLVEIASKILTILFLIYSARTMGVKNFGELSYALAIFMILTVISEVGASNLLVKISAQKEQIDKDFWTFTILRIGITLLAIIPVFFYLYISKASKEVVYFLVLSGLGMVIGCYGQNIGFVFRGRNKMNLDGAIRTSFSFFSALLGVIALKLGLGLLGVGFSYFIAYVLSTAIAFFINKKNSLILSLPHLNLSDFKDLIKLSAPFLLWMLLNIIYSRADTILLQHLRGPVEVGLYSAANRLSEAIMIIPMGIYMGILPILSALMSEKENKTIGFVSYLSIKYLAFLGFFIACYIVLTADKVVEVFYYSGEYNEAILPLQILTLGTVASFLYIVPAAILIASHIPHMTVWLSAITTGVNVLLNIFIIPKWGEVGASWVRLLTEVIGVAILNSYIYFKVVRTRYDFLFSAIASSIIVGVIIISIKSLLFLPLYFGIYCILIYLFRGVSKEEFMQIKDLILLVKSKIKTS